MTKERDFVTGASGFMGKHLVAKLDRPITIPHDAIYVSYPHNIRRFFFLSAYGNMAEHKSSEKIIRANVLDLGHITQHMMQSGSCPDSFVYMSSSSVNLAVQTPYSRTKRAAEEMLLASSLPCCILRPFSVTGRGEQPQHLIPTLIRSCMEGTAMNLVPGALHDFIDVDDVINALLILSEAKAVGIFELGTGIGWTNREVMEMVEDICRKKANVTFIDSMREYDNDKWYCKNFEAAQYGWRPTRTLTHSIEDILEEYNRERA